MCHVCLDASHFITDFSVSENPGSIANGIRIHCDVGAHSIAWPIHNERQNDFQIRLNVRADLILY